jgi:hypothetical protein
MKADQTTEHARAEALFKKQEQMREGAKVTDEYEAAQHAIREKTARLRALRLRAMLLAVIMAAEAQDEELEH